MNAWQKTLLLCGGIIIAGMAVIAVIFSTEPVAQREGATKRTAMLVDVIPAEAGSFRPVISATGTVVPSREIMLKPRVSGEILALSQNFTPGGMVKAGEVLVSIDPADYESELLQRESELREAAAALKIEMGLQNVAQQEYALMQQELKEENRALVLREPQLNAAQARVESARAAVDRANLNMERTEVKAPFDAQILTREVNLGSQVMAGEELARLVGLETYWIETTVPLSKLRWLSFPEEAGEKGSPVEIRNEIAWPEGANRQGYLYQMIGSLEDRTRLARVLVAVDDPLARQGDSLKPQLIIGSFVEVRIQTKELVNVVRLPREYLRQNDTVWVMREGKLNIPEVKVVFRGEDYIYFRDGLQAGDLVVTTNLATVVEGAPLRLTADESPAAKN